MMNVMADWEALARHVIDRRVEMGYHSREAFAQASGISIRTLGDIETARRASYAPETLVRLEKALEWPPGRVDEILNSRSRSNLVPLPAYLTPEMLAGLDPVRPGIEVPGLVADLLFLFTNERSRMTREDRDRFEAQLSALILVEFERLRQQRESDGELDVPAPTSRPARTYPDRVTALPHPPQPATVDGSRQGHGRRGLPL